MWLAVPPASKVSSGILQKKNFCPFARRDAVSSTWGHGLAKEMVIPGGTINDGDRDPNEAS